MVDNGEKTTLKNSCGRLYAKCHMALALVDFFNGTEFYIGKANLKNVTFAKVMYKNTLPENEEHAAADPQSETRAIKHGILRGVANKIVRSENLREVFSQRIRIC